MDPNAPFALYQTHLELLLRLSNLLHEGSKRLLSDSQHALERIAALQRKETERIQEATDWESLKEASATFAGDMMAQQTEDLRRLAEHAVESQLELASRAGEALADWQRATTGILRENLRASAA